jgi:predicted nucleic acid-binding protein
VLNPHSIRRLFVDAILQRARVFRALNPSVILRGEQLERMGFKAIDALHIAVAEVLRVDCFLTCDDRILKRAHMCLVKCQNPVTFIAGLMEKTENEHD